MQDYRYPLSRFLEEHFDGFETKELAMILVALHLIVKYHGDKPRRTGEPGWEHCLHVAATVRESKLGAIAIVCALLHDVLEDYASSLAKKKHQPSVISEMVNNLENTIEIEFGSKALSIVRYLTKTDKNTYMGQLVVGAEEHFEVAFIKLADRIHNISTVALLTDDTTWQKRYLCETTEEVLPTLERCTQYVPPEYKGGYELLLEGLRQDTQEALGLCHTPA